MRKTLFLLALLVVLATGAIAATTYSSGRHFYWVGTMPGTATTVATGTVYLVHGSFSTGGSSGTITITDRSGACSGDCDIATAIAIAANTTYEMDFRDVIAPSGFKISAGGTVTAHIHWTTQLQ